MAEYCTLSFRNHCVARDMTFNICETFNLGIITVSGSIYSGKAIVGVEPEPVFHTAAVFSLTSICLENLFEDKDIIYL